MKVSVVFVRVVTKPEYDHMAQRWLESYRAFQMGYPHELVVINRYADSPDSTFDKYVSKYVRYDGGGWDCGAWQFAGRNIESDLLVCFNSSTYVTGHDWLKRFVDAVEKHGDGLYGPLTSYEVMPHVRTPCMIFQPHVINDYPHQVNSREDAYRFECLRWPDGTPTFTDWVKNKGQKTMLVTWDGEYDQPDWRKPPNIFRRGDQSNLIVKDRHADTYEDWSADGKEMLEKLADGR